MGEMIDAAFVARAFDLYADHHNNCAGHGLNDQCSCGLLDARRAMLAAAPLAPSTPDAGVVKEWVGGPPDANHAYAWRKEVGDRLAASHTQIAADFLLAKTRYDEALAEQAKRIAGLEQQLERASEQYCHELNLKVAAESQLASLKADVERLTKCGAPDVGVACDAADKAGLPGVSRMLRALLGKWLRTDDRATKAEAERDTARAALVNIRVWIDSGDWSRLGDRIADECDTAVAALPLPALPKTKGDGT